MSIRVLFFLSLLTCSASVCAQSLEQLRYITEEYPPFNYKTESGVSGISVELLQEVWESAGISERPIELVPWARGYFDLQNNPDTVLFAVARTKQRERLFKWACPIVKTRYVLFGRKADKIKIVQKKQLKQYTIGTIRSDVGEQELLNMFTHPINILSNVSMQPNLELMEMGRVHLIAYDELAANGMLKEFGRNPDDYEVVFPITNSVTCFAFNYETDDAIVDLFQSHLTSIAESETYSKLVEKYFD